MSIRPSIAAFFDQTTNTVSYVVHDPTTNKCAIIDSVLDYDPASGRTLTQSADQLADYIHEQALSVEWIMETHVHADHLSAAPYLKDQLGGKIAIGAEITAVQDIFGKIFNEGTEFQRDGSQFDRLLNQGDVFYLGNIKVEVLHTPGHTPACMTYLIGDAAFVGDTIFMPDFGTARTDFPGGSAATLYRSIQKIFALPDDTRIFAAHDYKAPGRDEFAWESTVGEQKAENIHVGGEISETEFVKMRESRDSELGMPKLILPSVQVNIRAGKLPPAEENGIQYLKIPINKI